MRLLLLNLIALSAVLAPLLTLELLRSRVDWFDRHHDGLSIVVWLVALFVLYLFVLPELGLIPNPSFFQ